MNKVSIITPTFNREKLLLETIQSVRNQTHQNWEHLIVDDGSTDSTEARVLELSKQDNRIKYFKRKSSMKGANVCRNEGIEASLGNYILFLDSDDLLEPHGLEHRVFCTQSNPQASYAVFLCELFRDKPGDMKILWNCFAEENDLDRFLDMDPVWGISSTLWKAETIREIGPWDVRVLTYQDYEFHVRALILGYPYVKVPKADCFYRITSRGSLDRASGRKELFLSRAYMVGKISRLLRSQHKLDENKKFKLAQFYASIVEELETIGATFEAFHVWQRALSEGVLSTPLFLKGSAIFLKSKIASRNTAFRRSLFARGKFETSKTFCWRNPDNAVVNPKP